MSRKDWHVKYNGRVDDSIRDAANRGVALAAEHVLGEALKLVPIEEHTLEASGDVTTDPVKIRAAVIFDTPYAVYQHEVMDLKHDAGRSAKYLEIPLNAEIPAIREIIAQTIRGEL